MRILRAAVIAGAAIAALGLGLAALAFNPSLQTWALRRYLASRPGLGATVGRVAVGLGRVRIGDLRIDRGGYILAVPSADIDLPVLGDLWRREMGIREVTARGWTLDASRAPAGPGGGEFEGREFLGPEVQALVLTLESPRRFSSRLLGYDLSGVPSWGGLALEGKVVLPSAGPDTSGHGALEVELRGSPTTMGAAYSLGLSNRGRVFAVFVGHWTGSARRLAGRWKVDLDSAAGPMEATHGEGSFETTDSGMRVEGRLVGGASGFARVLPPLEAARAMDASARFDLVCRPGVWLVSQLAVEVGGNSPVLDVAALQPFEFNPSAGEVSLADPGKDLARITLRDVPVDWIRPWISVPAISGGRLSGDLVATPRGGGLDLRSQAPLSIRGLALGRNGRALAQGLEVVAGATAEVRPAGWQVDLSSMSVAKGGERLAALHLKFGRLAGNNQPLKFAGRVSAGIPGILALLTPDAETLKGGRLDCMFTGASNPGGPVSTGLEAQVGVSGLEAAGSPLPAFATAVRADFGPDGRLVFSAPIHIDLAGRESDVAVSGSLFLRGDGVAVDLQATGARLFIEDARLLAAVAVPAEAGRPFWGDATGRIAFAFKRASWPGNFEVANLNGVLRLDPSSLLFKDVHGTLDGGKISLDGALSPAAEPSGIPVFKADVRLDDFDFTPFFNALDSDRPATLEGRFDASGHLTGTGWDLLRLPGRFQGEWHLTSKEGLFRPLSSGVDFREDSPDKIAALGKFIGSVADTVTFRKDPRSLEKKGRAVSGFSKAVTGIRYDRIDVALSRTDSQGIGIDSFSLISPEIRLEGVGSVLATPGSALLAEPLELDLELRARGRVADLLRTAGLLADEKDDLGYSACTIPFDISGTLARPDMTRFRESLLKLMP